MYAGSTNASLAAAKVLRRTAPKALSDFILRGATSTALGIVMQHDTTNKFIIVHRDNSDWGKAGSQFSGTEIIQNM